MKTLTALALVLALSGCVPAMIVGATVLTVGPYIGVGASLAAGLNALSSMAVNIDKLRINRHEPLNEPLITPP